MAKYTTELRSVCETYSGLSESVGYNSVASVIDKSREKVFDFDYPIFDESYRPVLETKIIKHFYTREIGLETVGLFKLKLDERMNLIMPYYNKLYESTLLQFDPLRDVDVYTDHKGNGTNKGNVDSTTVSKGNSTTNSNGSDSNLVRYSDTPQGTVKDLLDNRYLTNATASDGSNQNTTATEDTSNGTSNQVSDYKTTDEYLQHTYGKTPSHTYGSLILELRKTFINVDEMIINELEPLFFQLW